MKDHSDEARDVLNAIREKPIVIKDAIESVARDGTLSFGMRIEVDGREIGIWVSESNRDSRYVVKGEP